MVLRALNPWLLERSSALEYAGYLKNAADALLQDLALRVSRTDGPIDELDASLGSIDRLWSWFVADMDDGFPGADREVRSSDQLFLEYPDSAESTLIGGMAEPLAFYVASVVKGSFPQVAWGLHPRGEQGTTEFQVPGLVEPIRKSFLEAGLVTSLALNAVNRRRADNTARRPERLRELVMRRFGEDGWLPPTGVSDRKSVV